MKKLLPILITLCLPLLFSCNKEEDKTPQQQPNNKQLLTNGNVKEWVLTSTLLNGSQVLQGCETDNLYSFYANGNSRINFGLNKCSASETQDEERKWEFIKNEQQLRWISAKDTFDMDINNLTANDFKVTQNTTYNGTPIQFVLTFKAK